MTGNIRTFPGAAAPKQLGIPNQALVSLLENALERARSGQLQSIIATGQTSENERLALWCTPLDTDVYQMLGSIVWLEHEYVARLTGNVEQTGRDG